MREGGQDESRNRCVHAGHLANALQSQLSMETCTCRLYLSWDHTDSETTNSRPTTIRTDHPSRPSRESLGSQAAKVRLVHGSLHTRPCKDSGTFLLGLTSSDCINQAWQTRAWNISPRRPRYKARWVSTQVPDNPQKDPRNTSQQNQARKQVCAGCPLLKKVGKEK